MSLSDGLRRFEIAKLLPSVCFLTLAARVLCGPLALCFALGLTFQLSCVLLIHRCRGYHSGSDTKRRI